MDERSEQPLRDAGQASDGPPGPPPGPQCFRILATVARTGAWSAEDAAHRESCPYCQRTAELVRREARSEEPLPAFVGGPDAEVVALPTPAPFKEYASLPPVARRNVDVAVIQAVLDLKPPDEICAAILRDHRVRLAPEQIKDVVHSTRANMELVYVAEADLRLEQLLQESFGLESVKVVRCSGVEPLTRWAAQTLRNIIVSTWDGRKRRLVGAAAPKVSVGFAGGPTSFNVMSACNHALDQEGFDGEVTVDAMLAGAFLAHMAFKNPEGPYLKFQDPWLATRDLRETNYGGYYNPPVITRADFRRLMDNNDLIQSAVRAAGDFDIVLTSGALWDDHHGVRLMALDYPESERREQGIVGELLWHPLKERPKPPSDSERVPLTSLGPRGLGRLTELIQNGTRVVAVLGPCVKCNRRKSPLVKSLLRLNKVTPLITDLVTDVQTAEDVARDLLGDADASRHGSRNVV